MKYDAAHPPVALTSRGVRVGDRHLPLLSGAVHYWRLDPDRWETVLDTIADLGFRIIETYIPWGVHERAPGHFDFGKENRARDLGRFLDLAHARGIFVLVRPGPHINSELTDFGFPARILADPRIQARTAHGTPAILPMFPRPFPAPSYASDFFLDEVRQWYTVVMPHIVPRLYSDGPVLAVQVDNEWSYFFRTGLYDLDYAPGALAGYRRFLLEQYGDVAAVNREYGTRHTRIDHVEPPRRYRPGDTLRWHMDWARHQSWALLEALRKLKDMLQLQLPAWTPLFTNLPPGSEIAPFDLSATEGLLDQVGLDLYHTRRELPSLQRAARYLNAQTRLPSCPEFGTGCFLTWAPTTPEDNRQATLAATMYGVRSFNFYMLVDRERWYGSPIRTSGQPRHGQADFYRALLDVFDRFDLASRPRTCEVALMRVRTYDRVGAIQSLLHPLPPLVASALNFTAGRFSREGELGEAARTHERWLAEWQKALQRADVDFDLADSAQHPALLKRYRMFLVPSVRRFDAALAQRLTGLAEDGAWVVLGPEMPATDLESGQPLTWPTEAPPTREGRGWKTWQVGAGYIVLLETPDQGLDDLLETAGIARTGIRGTGDRPEHIHGVRLGAHGDDRGLVWVMNTGADPQPVRVGDVTGLRDVFTAERLEPQDGAVHTRVDGWTVRLFEAL